MMLASMYRYDVYFFNKEITEKRYIKQFLSIKEPAPIPFFHLIRHRLVKKSLGYAYGVTDKKTYIDTFNWFVKYKTDTIGAISNILYQVYFMYGRLSIQEILALDNFNIYFNRACDHFKIEQRVSLLEYFKHAADDEIDLNIYYSIFQRFPEWVPLTKGNIFIGFDLARAVYISTAAFQLKYVSAQEVQEMINYTGEKTMGLFDSWTSFLASFIIGKYCWLAYEPDEACIGPMDETLNSIYGMIIRSSRPLAESGIWPDDTYTDLIDLIEKMIKFKAPDLPLTKNKPDLTFFATLHPELRDLVTLIRKYPSINKYFNRECKDRYFYLLGEKDYGDALNHGWIANQLERGEVFLASSNVPWPVWLSNKSLYYRKGYFSGKIHKIPLSHLHTILTFNICESQKQIHIHTPVCRIFELSYEEIKDNQLTTHFLGRKAEKEWNQFFMELKTLS